MHVTVYVFTHVCIPTYLFFVRYGYAFDFILDIRVLTRDVECSHCTGLVWTRTLCSGLLWARGLLSRKTTSANCVISDTSNLGKALACVKCAQNVFCRPKMSSGSVPRCPTGRVCGSAGLILRILTLSGIPWTLTHSGGHRADL